MTDDHGPDCACRECRYADAPPEAWADFVRGLIVVACIGILGALVLVARNAWGVEALPLCHSSIPQPPLVVVLPDGTEVPATSIEYDLASRRVVVIGNSRAFCDGFEG